MQTWTVPAKLAVVETSNHVAGSPSWKPAGGLGPSFVIEREVTPADVTLPKVRDTGAWPVPGSSGKTWTLVPSGVSAPGAASWTRNTMPVTAALTTWTGVASSNVTVPSAPVR